MLKYLGVKCHDVCSYFQMIWKKTNLERERKQMWQMLMIDGWLGKGYMSVQCTVLLTYM